MASSTRAFATRETRLPRAEWLGPRARLPVTAALGGLLVLTLLLAAALAPLVSPYDPAALDYDAVLRGPSAAHWLGTDSVGRDMLSRLLYGARVSLLVGLTAMTVSVLVGATVGLVAGYAGGWADEATMRLVDVFLAFPTVLLAIAIVAVLGAGAGNLILALGLTGWTEIARVVRAEVLAKKHLEYVEAARALGVPPVRIGLVHLLPNVIAPVIVLATLGVGTAIVAEAGLSFLGLGVQPPDASWGTILADGRSSLRQAPHVTTFAGLAIMLTVLGLSFLGDGLRDALDPTLRA